jgi:hypothetical protein
MSYHRYVFDIMFSARLLCFLVQLFLSFIIYSAKFLEHLLGACSLIAYRLRQLYKFPLNCPARHLVAPASSTLPHLRYPATISIEATARPPLDIRTVHFVTG